MWVFDVMGGKGCSIGVVVAEGAVCGVYAMGADHVNGEDETQRRRTVRYGRTSMPAAQSMGPKTSTAFVLLAANAMQIASP